MSLNEICGPGESSGISKLEEAYLRFETPKQEVRKAIRRLRHIGAVGWPKDWKIIEIFYGRGNGLHALSRLGLTI